MRIGILTHHYVKNYGAFLQMKAMYETLRRLYPKAEIVVVNYVNPRHWRKNIIHILHFRFGIDTPATYIKNSAIADVHEIRTYHSSYALCKKCRRNCDVKTRSNRVGK